MQENGGGYSTGALPVEVAAGARLVRAGLATARDVLELFRFLDWVMRLPEVEENRFAVGIVGL